MIGKDTLLIGDQAIVKYNARVEKGVKLIFPKPDSIGSGLEIVKSPVIDTVSTEGNYNNIETSITITSFDSGSHYLPPIPIYLQKQNGTIDTLWIEGQNLEFTTIPIDTTTFKPYDIKGQERYPITFSEVALWGGLTILFFTIVFIIYKYIKSLKSRKSVSPLQKTQNPPHITALIELEKINGEQLWQKGKEKLFYTKITDVLRIYISDRYSINAMEMTTSEIIPALKNDIVDKDHIKLLKDILSLSDLVKFAKFKASQQDNESVIPNSVRFINQTYLKEIEKEG